MATVAVIGESMLEFNGTPFNTTIYQSYGGDTLNTAVYLARLLPDHTIHYVTAVGEDVVSQALVNEWDKEGIDISHVLNFADKTVGLYWVVVDDSGERSFIYWRKNSAASQWLKHSLAQTTLAQILRSDWVYLTGISLAILAPNDREVLFNWLDYYKAQGGKIAFDSNYRSNLWEDTAQMQSCYATIMDKTDLALLTIEDEAAILGLPEATVSARLKNHNCPAIILKQGAKGALIIQGTQSVSIASLVVDKIVDTTAAGDSFNAGVIAALLNGKTMTEACKIGHQLAGHVIQHKGAIISKAQMPLINY